MRPVRKIITILLVCAMLPVFAFAETDAARKARLEAELAQLESEIAAQQELLNEKSSERQSLERDVSLLEAEIAKAELEIRHRNLSISSLVSEIGDRQVAIRTLDEKLAREKASLAQILRRTNEIDDTSFVELTLSSGTLSDVFEDMDSFDTVKLALSNSFVAIADTKESIETQKSALEARKIEEQELKSIQVLEKTRVAEKKEEKGEILEVTKGEEEAYQRTVEEKKQTAAQIRAALFSLRDSAAIPFGQAYDYALEASAKTGVRPALILAILTQETNLGENVGQCLLTNTPNKGDGKGKNTGRYFAGVMKPTRDVDPFMQITAELGLDPYSMVVSCPPGYGYGGAMGPAQFIPSTWVLYQNRLAKATATNPPNPWEPRTAIFATAMLMEDNGADGGTYYDERRAALRYFAGGNWNKAAYAFYGDDVMELAGKIQAQIDIIEG